MSAGMEFCAPVSAITCQVAAGLAASILARSIAAKENGELLFIHT